jgi:trimeric autotransporter adhesin
MAQWSCVLLTALASACDNGPATPDDAGVDSIVVAPRTGSVNVGSSLPLSAEALDADGQAIPSASVTWSSEDVTIAGVSRSGLVTGVSPGTVLIAASAWGKNAVATITVNPTINVFPEVGRIVIAPSNPRITEGESLQMTATVLDVEDRVIMGLTVTWSSSNSSRATVDNAGLVRGISAGTVTIAASAGGKTGSTTVRVER